ncbi:tRNA-specific 2-thiouridylase [Williamsia limnetica]|jgi:tRNA-specific 2-thiouridylase|uniref:tRNA-specific 2-thiouridylase MnmA n=1 Tax=Williamsia limnetica TaxID=882452 RepID=A0A318RFY4_WILLI|nr:tRNA 2-thiouridine(34) synthase MnmA [Williamsia limnetica]PYE15587.1 tRNA-specific 2-thiouridylase [Williamsia limnetica]
MRVLAAMSGGVDSAVAAARAVDAGHDVVGVHLALSTAPGALRTGSRGCCSREDAGDARRAADVLGIPFYVWDFADRFKDDVIDEFVAAYAAGQTPNPCLTCNEKIKFSALSERAVALGFDAVATGHYARLDNGELRRAVDEDKDQSYVLAVLTPQQLSRAMFPIGDTPKDQIRAEAAARQLSVANKPDSHDICFIPTGDTRAFLGATIGVRPGKVVDADSGAELGDHEGVHGFTIGQRKGLGIDAPAADGKPRYVTEIDPDSGTVTVGSSEHLQVWTIVARRAIWTSGTTPTEPFEAMVQVRAHGGLALADVEPLDGDGTDGVEGPAFRIRLRSPLTGVARGQAAVLYRPDAEAGDLVLGSGRIAVTGSVPGELATSAGK